MSVERNGVVIEVEVDGVMVWQAWMGSSEGMVVSGGPFQTQQAAEDYVSSRYRGAKVVKE